MRARYVVAIALTCIGLALAAPSRAVINVTISAPDRIAPGGGQFGFEGFIDNVSPDPNHLADPLFITSDQITYFDEQGRPIDRTFEDFVKEDLIPNPAKNPLGPFDKYDGVQYTDHPTSPPPGFVPDTHNVLFVANMGGPDDRFFCDIRLFGGPPDPKTGGPPADPVLLAEDAIFVGPIPNAVPEPGSAALLAGSTVAGLCFLGRRARQRSAALRGDGVARHRQAL